MGKDAKNTPQSSEVTKEEHKKALKEEKKQLAIRVGELQRRVKELGIPVMIFIDGWSAAGKGEIINDLMIPLDPRNFIVYNTPRNTHELRNRPLLYDCQINTPERGQIVLFDSSYYAQVYKRAEEDKVSVEKQLVQINEFEEAMAEDGTVILKFFFQISQKTQRKRLKALESDPIASWRATESDWKQNKNYEKIRDQWDAMIPETDTGNAPWSIVVADDLKAASYEVLRTLVTRLEHAVSKKEKEKAQALHPLITGKKASADSLLMQFNPEDTIPKTLYKDVVKEYQNELRQLEFLIFRKRIPVMLAFEGFDAAGKGGAIKRIAENLDPRGYRVYPSAAPSNIEKEHNWLWRYWRTIPKRGHFSIYDRTWYGRVLVEPIEGFCTEKEYEDAFGQIRSFEKELTEFGTVILKFWMNVSDEEQTNRFHEREADPLKRWKITEEDWRNQKKRSAYIEAADRMFAETSSKKAPWIIINGNDKLYARIKVLSTIIGALRKAVNAGL